MRTAPDRSTPPGTWRLRPAIGQRFGQFSGDRPPSLRERVFYERRHPNREIRRLATRYLVESMVTLGAGDRIAPEDVLAISDIEIERDPDAPCASFDTHEAARISICSGPAVRARALLARAR